ncbi:MAG TPA: hypothetical protein VI728_13040 [Syntrophales bacterium]|nr:hypothetical protein [Syntrophales bacterium]
MPRVKDMIYVMPPDGILSAYNNIFLEISKRRKSIRVQPQQRVRSESAAATGASDSVAVNSMLARLAP